MTCIVAVTDGETVVMGGDSAGTGGKELRLRADSKVFCTQGYVIGYTTSYRMGQLLRYVIDLPKPPLDQPPEELHGFLVTEFVPIMRGAFSEHGFAKTGQFSSPWDPNVMEVGQELGGLFLLGVDGQIFEMGNDYQVGQPKAPYSAVGSGAIAALGALHALEANEELTLHERVRMALAASESYCTLVRRPFRLVESS